MPPAVDDGDALPLGSARFSGRNLRAAERGRLGIKGVFPASFPATAEDATGARVVDHFDSIAGTASGGVIALGLDLGFSAAGILAPYERMGSQVFRTGGTNLLRRVVSRSPR